ncbi:MAG: glycoside hydrolase family 71/99 protein [Limisphaerales bacterium]
MNRTLILAGWLSTHSLLAGDAVTAANPGTPWPATDALGRALPTASEVGPLKSNRFVGIFYFLWQSTEVRGGTPEGEPYNVAKILAQDPEALKKPASPLWGPIGVYHYWAEPLMGYYANDDPWVLRRHAQWLADAGVDTLIFDATNVQTYRKVYLALCATFEEVRRAGGHTPQIAFMVNTEAGRTADTLFRELYQPGQHRDLWFNWQGKPLLLCDPAEARPEWKDFFTLRRAHWPFTLTNTPSAWHWEATFPQPYGYTDDPGRPEQVNVSVAQNLRQADGKVTNMSDGNARGRSFHDGRQDPTPGAVNWGHNFQEQWRRVFELNPPFAMVTGWNEWIAGRWGQPGGPLVFVDQYDQEFSRDIEPVKGGHGDNYYLQLIANVRRYKGAPPLPHASAPKTLRLADDFEAWREVLPVFTDAVGDTASRDHVGVLKLRYTSRSGRNDIVSCQIARDRESVYFHVQTREPLTAPTGANWMWLLIDADQNRTTGWEGYDYIVNRTIAGDGMTWLEKHVDGWGWREAARLRYRVEGTHLHLAIPRTALGRPDRDTNLALDFKWVDHSQEPGNLLDFYVNGDAAPEGRLNYRYVAD